MIWHNTFSSKLSPLLSVPFIRAYLPRYFMATSKSSRLYSNLFALMALHPLELLRGENTTHSLSRGSDEDFHSLLVMWRLIRRPSSRFLRIPLPLVTKKPHPLNESKNLTIPITLCGSFLFCSTSSPFPSFSAFGGADVFFIFNFGREDKSIFERSILPSIFGVGACLFSLLRRNTFGDKISSFSSSSSFASFSFCDPILPYFKSQASLGSIELSCDGDNT